MKKIPSRTHILRELHFHGVGSDLHHKRPTQHFIHRRNMADKCSVTWLGTTHRRRPQSHADRKKTAAPPTRRWLPGSPSLVPLEPVHPRFSPSPSRTAGTPFTQSIEDFSTYPVDLIAWPTAFTALAISSHRKKFFLFVTMLVSFAWRASIFSSTFSVSTAILFWEKLGFHFLVLASTSTTSDIVFALLLLFIFRALSVARARIRNNKFETGLTSVNRRLVNRGLNARWKTALIPPISYSGIKKFILRLTANRRLT